IEPWRGRRDPPPLPRGSGRLVPVGADDRRRPDALPVARLAAGRRGRRLSGPALPERNPLQRGRGGADPRPGAVIRTFLDLSRAVTRTTDESCEAARRTYDPRARVRAERACRRTACQHDARRRRLRRTFRNDRAGAGGAGGPFLRPPQVYDVQPRPASPRGGYVRIYPLGSEGFPAIPGRFYPVSGSLCFVWNRARTPRSCGRLGRPQRLVGTSRRVALFHGLATTLAVLTPE